MSRATSIPRSQCVRVGEIAKAVKGGFDSVAEIREAVKRRRQIFPIDEKGRKRPGVVRLGARRKPGLHIALHAHRNAERFERGLEPRTERENKNARGNARVVREEDFETIVRRTPVFSPTPKRMCAPTRGSDGQLCLDRTLRVQNTAVWLEYSHFVRSYLQGWIARVDLRFAQDLNPQVVLPGRALRSTNDPATFFTHQSTPVMRKRSSFVSRSSSRQSSYARRSSGT
jgi:hypothetical protein